MHGVPIDPALLIGVREDEAVIADHVDEPWDPSRIFGDPVHRWICEQTQVARAGDTKPGPDILSDFVQSEGRNLAAQPDPRSEERRVGKECRSRWSPYH